MKKYDYSKLLGLIRERGLTQDEFAAKIGICPSSLCQKIHNRRDFGQEEIVRSCVVLGISAADMHKYFFCGKTLEN